MSDQIQSISRGREQARKQIRGLNGFDYKAPAELFPSRSKKGRGVCTYRRFDTAAEALRYAIEEMPEAALLGAYLEVDEARFGVQEIRALYDSAAYPLKRRANAS
jgi:hypothetical protein